MNKKLKLTYSNTNRQVKKRRNTDMIMSNLVHDNEYTFANEFYDELKADYFREYLSEKEDEEESPTN